MGYFRNSTLLRLRHFPLMLARWLPQSQASPPHVMISIGRKVCVCVCVGKEWGRKLPLYIFPLLWECDYFHRFPVDFPSGPTNQNWVVTCPPLKQLLIKMNEDYCSMVRWFMVFTLGPASLNMLLTHAWIIFKKEKEKWEVAIGQARPKRVLSK